MASTNPAMPDNAAPNRHSVEPAATPPSERESLDARIQAGETLPPALLLSVLRDENPPTDDLLHAYARQLLDYAVNERDADAAILVTHLMDAHPALDAALNERLTERLQVEPDAVYAFLRARMTENTDARWLERLRIAALSALHIAITDGDSETASNWLRLIAREPASYELSDIVHNGILAAAERARTDGQLGRLLIPLAVRRDPAALETLLADQAVLDAMAAANNLGRVLRDYEGDPLLTLQNHGYEMFIVAMARAAQAGKGALFTPATVEHIWSTLNGTQPVNVPAPYTPEHILEAWSANGAAWLDESALQAILTLALRERRDDLFLSVARQMIDREFFLRQLGNALQRSGRPEGDVIALTAQMLTAGDLTPQGALDVYVRLLGAWEWRRSSLPLVHQLVRMVHQHPTLAVPVDALWHLVALAAEAKDDGVARVAVRRLTAEFELIEDEAVLTDNLMRLVNETLWNPGARAFLVSWWRFFIRSSTLARLQRLDKMLEGRKPLDEMRTIVQTVIAFRKMLGKRSLQQFAVDVGVAYGIMQALNESFDPSARRPVAFDQATIRAELDSRADELTPHEQKIMANNFKELAQLISEMGDNRSKASLMRRGDDVDRLLMTGDQQPHSAVDALKWLSGYLSGSQEKDDEGDDSAPR